MEHFGWFAAGSGPNPDGWDLGPLNIRQVSIFFTVYVFFQVWNQINGRSLTPEMSGFSGLFRNPTFLVIAGTVAVVQVLIVSVPFVGTVFKVEPLGWLDWLCILAGTASVLVFGEVPAAGPPGGEAGDRHWTALTGGLMSDKRQQLQTVAAKLGIGSTTSTSSSAPARTAARRRRARRRGRS